MQKCRIAAPAPFLRSSAEYGLNPAEPCGEFNDTPACARTGEVVMTRIIGGLSALAGLLSTGSALAQQPRDWQMTFQPAATNMMEQIAWFEGYTLWFIVPITLLVLVLLGWCILKF